MRCRKFPRTLLLVAGISAAGFFVPHLASAQTDGDGNGMEYEHEHTMTKTTTTTSSSQLSPPYDSTSEDQRMEEQMTTTKTETKTTVTDSSATIPPPPITETEPTVAVSDTEGHKLFGFGLGIEAGGGVNEFSSGRIASVSDPGGAWTARLTVGTRSPISMEAAYIGSANTVQTIGLDRSTLVGHGAEGDLKLNLALVPLNEEQSFLFKPYLLAGFAWKRYTLQGDSFNTSSVEEKDDVFEVPIGLGMGWNFGHFIADQRFDYRPSVSGDIMKPVNGVDQGNLATWSVTARVGVEF